MIPLHLTLKNFLSYQQASLDLRGLHTACICGANGAGKSSLLESITWVLWGQSRSVTEDDVIHGREKEVQVDFIFISQQQIYRVIRSRQRKQSTLLEFQVGYPPQPGSVGSAPTHSEDDTTAQSLGLANLYQFRSLTEKGLRATQQRINQTLKLDYETFINSAYLRQGRADEFMLKRPNERKQILADLLKLGEYDELSEKARERSREYKAQATILEQSLHLLEQQLQEEPSLAQLCHDRQQTLAILQQEQEQDLAASQHIQAQQQAQEQQTQTLELLRQQYQQLQQHLEQLTQDQTLAAQHQQDVEQILQQQEQILAGYQSWQALQHQDEALSHQAQAHQQATQRQQQLRQELMQQEHHLQSQLDKAQVQWEQLQRQQLDLQEVLQKKVEVAVAVQRLCEARDRLQQLDQLQTKVNPLMQRHGVLQSQLRSIRMQLSTRLEQLQAQRHHWHTQEALIPQLQQEFDGIDRQVQYLEQRQSYLEQVREKGQERRSFLDRLMAHHRDYENQLEELDQKMAQLQDPGMPCPLCSRPLDDHHWQIVQQQHQRDRQEILDLIWVIKDQKSVSDREIQVLRQEYQEVKQTLEALPAALEKRGQLQQQIRDCQQAGQRCQQLAQEIEQLEQILSREEFEPDLQGELRHLTSTLAALAYDDRTHALARGEVERWRWGEIRQAEIQAAERQYQHLEQQRPHLENQIYQLQQALASLTQSPIQQELLQLEQQLLELDYDLDRHTALRRSLREAQEWVVRHQELTKAEQLYPQIQERQRYLSQQFNHLQGEIQTLHLQIQNLQEQLTHAPNLKLQGERLQAQIQQRRSLLEQQWAALGRLQQQQRHLANLRQQWEQQQAQLQHCRYQHRIHQELVQAFGKNGIQALLIENLLPQLESETNHILSRLSANQLHVQFITQRTRRSSRPGHAQDKLIDTLDICIADVRGTRPYETYSGGEAFRVNFSIRLALARLLAQRSGAALQLLIVDEGFGTQDTEGCDRLIAAINAIASDFACILTITHMAQFKEAFQTRIEVTKTGQGSQLTLTA